jgi:hypothetical protein
MRTRTWGTASLAAITGFMLVLSVQAQDEMPGRTTNSTAPVNSLSLRTETDLTSPWWEPTAAREEGSLLGRPVDKDDGMEPNPVGQALIPSVRNQAEDSVAPRQPIIRAQAFSPASPEYPLPVYRENIEQGGFYTAFSFIMWHLSTNINHQLIAIHGFFDTSLDANGGRLEGSGGPALYADDVAGPTSWLPGWKFEIGWKFADGTAITAGWTHIQEYTYHAVANLVPPGFVTLGGVADTFISSFVYNFGSDYAGEPNKTAYGIWNAADQMELSFSQRYDQYDLSWRQTITQDDSIRCYGLIGPRFAWIWERFLWRTVSENAASELDVGVYNNIVSNRMYGVSFGTGTDWWLGNGFAATLEFRATPYLDIVREWAAYQLGDHLPLRRDKRSKRDYTIAGELEGSVALYWYPIQGVSVRLGYEAMEFINTFGMDDPVDFNLGRLTPAWEHKWFRFFHGFDVGISFIF